MTRTSPRTLPFLGLLLLAAGCNVPQLDLTPRYGVLSIDGEFGASSSNISGRASLEAAGLDDDEGFPGLRADVKFGSPHLILSAGRASWAGSGIADAALDIGGDTINVNDPVESEFDLNLYQALLVFDMFPTNVAEIALGVGVTGFDYDLLFRSETTSETIESDELVPIPVIALNVGAQLGPIEVAGLVSGFSVDYEEFDGTYIDADLYARYRILGGKNHLRSSIVLGWRQIEVEFEYDDDGDLYDADFGISGPYLGMEFTL